MNTSLFASRLHSTVALLSASGGIAWLVLLGASPGAREGSNRLFVLVSGWASLVLMGICFLYVPRKYLYKVLGRLRRGGKRASTTLGPESVRSKKLRESQRALEKAEGEIEAVRAQVKRGILATRAEVSARVREILGKNRVTHLVKPVVLAAARPAATGGPERTGGPSRVAAAMVLDEDATRFVIRLVPREPLARMARWLHAHFYYGLAFGAAVLLHGGFSIESPIGWAMAGLSAVVVGTGLLGTILFARGPIWLTPEKPDLGLEQCLALTAHTERKVGELLDEASRKGLPKLPAARFFKDGGLPEWGSEPALRMDIAVLFEQRRRFRANLLRLRWVRFWMNLWRALHVPASLLLAAVVIVHVLSVWWY